MDYVEIGRTGLRASVAGLGCGGASRLGQGTGASRSDSVQVVRTALDLGINFIDTAAAYGTEQIVAEAIAGRRNEVILSTKIQVVPKAASTLADEIISPADFRAGFEASLKRLATDHVDVLHLHGVMPAQYRPCRDTLMPVMARLRDQGKLRFIGITERFVHDPQHVMLQAAFDDDGWDVMMTGFNLINQSAAPRVLKAASAKGIGTLIMFAVRRALSDPKSLADLMTGLICRKLLDSDAVDQDHPLDFLIHEGGAASLVDGAYRYCRHQPGADVILTGTGNVDHLRANVTSILSGPLADACQQRLHRLFGAIDSVSGN